MKIRPALNQKCPIVDSIQPNQSSRRNAIVWPFPVLRPRLIAWLTSDVRQKVSRITWLLPFLLLPALSGAETRDARQPVALNAEEKAYVLGRMRDHLGAIQKILSAAGSGDSSGVKDVATARGTVAAAGPDAFRKAISEKTPPGWRSLLVTMRAGFDDVAKSGAKNDNSIETVQRVSSLMNSCIACHATYRLVDEK
jgi:hypothetical protein